MPPPEALNEAPVLVVDAQGPLPARDVHGAAVGREMEFGQEDLRGRVLGAGRIAAQRQREGRVAEVEAVGLHFACGGEGARPHVGFGGAKARVGGQGGGAGGGGHGGRGECAFEIGVCDGRLAVGGAGM